MASRQAGSWTIWRTSFRTRHDSPREVRTSNVAVDRLDAQLSISDVPVRLSASSRALCCRLDVLNSHRRTNMANKNTICLWYDGTALDAARFYAETFPDSAVGSIMHAPGDYPDGKQGQ